MIHKFEQNGLYIVLDVYSGAVHVVDRLIYLLLDFIDAEILKSAASVGIIGMESDYTEQECTEAMAEIIELYKAGLLFSEDTYGGLGEYSGGEIPVKALCLHVAHDCNMRCGYCFAATGDFGGERRIMAPETAEKALDFVLTRSGKRRNIEIDFFGGEPLMAFDTVRRAVDYARSREETEGKNFRFTITTNGLLLDDEKIGYINQNMSNVVLSLDGRREVNDRLRRTPDDRGTYDLVLQKMQSLVSTRGDKDYYLRGTFTAENLDFSNDIEHISDLGFENVSVEPVVCPPDRPYAIRQEHLPQIFAEYDRLAERLEKMREEGRGITFFHFMIDLSQGPCVIKRVKGCGAGSEYLAITPEGDIYPCHQFVGQKDFLMGNIFENTFNAEISKKFASITLNSREKCVNCWAKYYCSGGCSAANFFQNGDLLEPYSVGCETEKKRLECAIYLTAKERL